MPSKVKCNWTLTLTLSSNARKWKVTESPFLFLPSKHLQLLHRPQELLRLVPLQLSEPGHRRGVHCLHHGEVALDFNLGLAPKEQGDLERLGFLRLVETKEQ